MRFSGDWESHHRGGVKSNCKLFWLKVLTKQYCVFVGAFWDDNFMYKTASTSSEQRFKDKLLYGTMDGQLQTVQKFLWHLNCTPITNCNYDNRSIANC